MTAVGAIMIDHPDGIGTTAQTGVLGAVQVADPMRVVMAAKCRSHKTRRHVPPLGDLRAAVDPAVNEAAAGLSPSCCLVGPSVAFAWIPH